MIPRTLTDIVIFTLNGKCVEPVPRVKDMDHVPRGFRHLPVAPRYVGHRYEIRGGITRKAELARLITSDNTLMRKLLAK